MRPADLLDRLQIGIVERAARDLRPVLDLGLLGAPDRGVVGEQSGQARRLDEVRVELVENRRQGLCDQRLQFAERLPRRGVDPDEIKPRPQGLFVVHVFSRFLMGAAGAKRRGKRSSAATYAATW